MSAIVSSSLTQREIVSQAQDFTIDPPSAGADARLTGLHIAALANVSQNSFRRF